MPSSLSQGEGKEREVAEKLLKMGYLSLTDKAHALHQLVERGFERMVSGPERRSTLLGRYDSEFETVQIFIRADGLIGVNVWDQASYIRCSLKPILSTIGLKSEAARWAACVINQHYGCGSTSSWDDIIRDMGGSSRTEDGEWQDGESDNNKTTRNEAFAKLEKQYPWLFKFQYKEKLVDVFNKTLVSEAPAMLKHIRRRDRALGDIFERLHGTLGRQSFAGSEPYCVLIWEKDDVTDHAWDYITYQISEGNYDTSGNALIDCIMDLESLPGMFKKVDAWLSPVDDLVRWSQDHGS